MTLDLRLQPEGNAPPWLPRGFRVALGSAGVEQSIGQVAGPGETMSLRSPDAVVRWRVERHVAGAGAEVCVYDTGPCSQVLVTGPATVTRFVVLALCTSHYVEGRGTLDNTVTNASPAAVVTIGRDVGWLARPDPVIVADSGVPVASRDVVTLPAAPATVEVCVPPGRSRVLRVTPGGNVVNVTVQSWLSVTVIGSAVIPATGGLLGVPVYGRVFAGAAGAVPLPCIFTWDPGA